MELKDDHRLFFSINSGRAGSQYLAKLLATGLQVAAFHEVEPTMSGRPLFVTNDLPLAASRDERRVKVAAIHEALGKLQPGWTYVETNHMFIKTFHDVVLEEFGDRVEVLILRRELALVLKSFIEMGYFSPLNEVWPKWMSIPGSANAALELPKPYSQMDQFDRCIAYLLDIEARGARFRQQYPQTPIHEVHIGDLQDTGPVLDLFRRLRLRPTPSTLVAASKTVNARTATKRRMNNPTDLNYCRHRLHDYLDRLERKSIPVPAGIALER